MSLSCPVCEKEIEEGSSARDVKKKGVERLLEASIQRKDGKARILRGKTSIKLHISCQKKYTHPHNITSYLKIGPKQQEATSSSSLPTTRASVPAFKFKTHCFLCAEKITEEFIEAQKKVSPEKRNVIYPVRSHSVKDKVLKQAELRGDDWAKAIVHRIHSVEELPPLDAQYHRRCMRKLYQRAETKEKKKSGQFPSEIEKAMECIYAFMEGSEECQFSIAELMKQIEGDYQPDTRTIKTHLVKKYGEDIVITTTHKTPVVCFKKTGFKILTDSWYQRRSANEAEERLRVVKAAALIIAEDIRSKVYETDQYPPADEFLNEPDSVVPDTLRVLTESIILNHKKGSFENWRRKCTAIAHSIISAVRPRSFLSSLQVGLATFLYKKFGSRKLIDVVSSLGFCSSYTEAVRFEVSSIMSPPIEIENNAFSQFVYDNADFNTQTLDGFHTFHAMGGIHCIHPKSAVVPQGSINRVLKVPSAQTVRSFGVVQMHHFHKKSGGGLKTVILRDLDEMLGTFSRAIVPRQSDLLWLYGKWADVPGMPGWSTFMEQVTDHLPFQQTMVNCLPFVNAPPSDYDTVYTVLMSSAEKCKFLNQQTCLVTFDQPLYFIAKDIVSCQDPNLKNVIPRLGGFHLLMSYLGAIGFIMGGSGLKELFNTIYAMNSIDKILSGHAYARAVRGHILAHAALASTIMDKVTLTLAQRSALNEILIDPNSRSTVLSKCEENITKDLIEIFMAQVQQLKGSGPTGKLWIQYFYMVTLAKQFIEAERMGDWNLHLETVAKMLPFFHASGHFSYAKCGHLYLQDMVDLEKTMDPSEYRKLTVDGGFTIRRSDRFWCGTWSDMTIEQTLMKTMKTSGGLTHGRGVSESILARWTMGMTSLQHVCDRMEKFCSVSFASSEQHLSYSDTRVKRDNHDCNKMKEWLEQHNPFPPTSHLISISTGLVGDSTINCHMSEEVGIEGIQRIQGQNVESIKFKRIYRVQPLAVMSTGIRIEGRTVPINPTVLFQRISIAKQSDKELKDFLKYELCPYPLSLFDEGGMRKTTKSTLYKVLQPCGRGVVTEDSVYVIDGGHLLHRVPWSKGATFSMICHCYVEFVRSKYKSSAVTVFDGYPENEAAGGTKFAERARRSQKKVSSEILFDENMTPTVSQENFLTNPKNKTRLIALLMSKFAEAGMVCEKAREDADCLIISRALNYAPNNSSVVVVGDDVDLLVILTSTCTHPNVYFLKPGKGKVEERVYSPRSALDPAMSKNLLFVHAISGCDTTSALYNQGKIKVYQTLRKYPLLQHAAAIFRDSNASPQAIANSGKQFLVALYGGPEGDSATLNSLRYRAYVKSSFNRVSNLSSLPPTEAAAEQHLYRVYLQVQQWLGVEKVPEEWGWERTANGLQPVLTTLPPGPEAIMKKISCRCRQDCRRNCGCRKAGLFCSLLCLHCGGNNCKNGKTRSSEDDEESLSEEKDDPLTFEAESLREANSPLTIMVEEFLSSQENIEDDAAQRPSTSASQPKRQRLK